jgi:hypothetical protein
LTGRFAFADPSDMFNDRGGFQVRETAHQATGAPARTPIPAVASLRIDAERLERIWALSRSERIAAAQRGQLTLGEMLRWASRRPHEVPLVNRDFFFITALSADAAAAEED